MITVRDVNGAEIFLAKRPVAATIRLPKFLDVEEGDCPWWLDVMVEGAPMALNLEYKLKEDARKVARILLGPTGSLEETGETGDAKETGETSIFIEGTWD